MFDNYPDVLTIEEVTKVLQIGKNSIYKLIRSNELRSIRIGKLYRVPKSDLIEYVEGGMYNAEKCNGRQFDQREE